MFISFWSFRFTNDFIPYIMLRKEDQKSKIKASIKILAHYYFILNQTLSIFI